MSTFAELLTQHVEASGMKQVAIASAAGITYNYLHLLLGEKRKPSEQVVQLLAQALRLSPEQTGELLTRAGYAPSPALLSPSPLVSPSTQQRHLVPSAPEDTPTGRLMHRCFRLAQEVPAPLQPSFVEEMGHLLDYARYKYVLCQGVGLTELRLNTRTLSEKQQAEDVPDRHTLDLLAAMIGELYGENGESEQEQAQTATQAPHLADLLDSIDQITGVLLSEKTMATRKNFPHLIEQITTALHQGVPWEIRRRIAEALPGLCMLDTPGASHIMELMRLDHDEKYGVDIRRRVIESLPCLFDADPALLPSLLALLEPQSGDDLYVALASVEVCGDLQTRLKQSQQQETAALCARFAPISPEQAALLTLRRRLLGNWEGSERETIQYSLALYDLLCAPDALFLSIQEGLQSPDKRLQLVAVRYLERLLPGRTAEVLHAYQMVLAQATSRNVRRTVVRALPALLTCLQEASLSVRTLVRSVLLSLATDSDLHIRRTMADYAWRMFAIDREFLLTMLRHLYQDHDPAIRHRLQPVVLRLAQVWLLWYAETAGLVRTTRHKTATPFGD